MTPIQHRLCNKVYEVATPQGPDNPIRPLPVLRLQLEDGRPAVVSFWKPSEDELRSLQAGAVVAVWSLGESIRPMHLEVEPQ